MKIGGRAGTLLVALVVALAVPAAGVGTRLAARTQPQASGVLSQPPTEVRLTYSERIEPRFAVISVTDADGNQQIAGSPARTADDENAIFVPVKHVSQGWYLVWWRVISADGHPVRGAFTFAVGPSPGPPPQFVIPSLGESAATPSLVGSRWVLLLACWRHRPARVPRRDRTAAAGGGRERARAAVVTAAPGWRSPSRWSPRPSISSSPPRSSRSDPGTDLGEIIPLVRDSGFGRSFSDLWVVLGLLAVASSPRSRSTGRAARPLRRGVARGLRRGRLRGSGARFPAWRATPRRRAPSD